MHGPRRILTFGGVCVEGPTGPIHLAGRLGDVLLLLLEGGDGWTSRDALIDRLWADDDSPPPSARSALRTYVSKLRDALGGDVVQTRKSPCTYRLDRSLVQSDLDEIRTRLKTGRSLLSQDPSAALAEFGLAKRLAHGEPYGGSDLPWLAASRMAAAELIDDLDDEYCTALVRAGEAGSRIDEIARLVEVRPLRERRVEMLIRTLRQAGRRREALQLCHAHHHRMVELTGLSANASIRALEQELLLDDDRAMPDPVRANLDDLVAALTVERFAADPASLAEAMGLPVVTIASLAERGLAQRTLYGSLDALKPPPGSSVSQATALLWHERWQRVPSLPIWRNLAHRLMTGVAGIDAAGDVLAAVRLACDVGQVEAAEDLLAIFEQVETRSVRAGAIVDRRAFVRLNHLHAELLDQLGRPAQAMDKRSRAVDVALTEQWFDLAAMAAATDGRVGRSYVENTDLTTLIRRTLGRVAEPYRRPLTVGLLSELLCRSVLDAGLTPELALLRNELLALGPFHEPLDRMHAYRAEKYVGVASGIQQDFSELETAAAEAGRLGLHDHQSDLLVIAARAALERGDLHEWSTALAALADVAANSRRPVDLWNRTVLRATELQIHGQHKAAAAQSEDAADLGQRWSVADWEVAAAVHTLSGEWQRGQFRPVPEEQLDDEERISYARMLLSGAWGGEFSPNEPLLEVMVSSAVTSSRTENRSLESLPALVITTEAAWRAKAVGHGPVLLETLSTWRVSGVAVGMVPVGCFGPLGRFKGLAAMLAGEFAVAATALDDALDWCVRMNAPGWAAATLEDLADLDELRGGDEAATLRAEALHLRHARRLSTALLSSGSTLLTQRRQPRVTLPR